MPAGFPKVDINFILNADGILKIQAIELRSGVKQEVEVKPAYGINDELVEQMLMDSITHAKDDVAPAYADRSQNRRRTDGIHWWNAFCKRMAAYVTAEETAETHKHYVVALKESLRIR
jgi:molecular chaperone DnaK (HSP70)